MSRTSLSILTAAAVLAAACAATAGDEFKIYGKLHMSVESHDDGEDNWLALSNNGSRFGLKGSREMNDDFGLKWQFEQAINIAQKGAETLATRNSYLGLTGPWGTVLYGIHDTPFKTMGSKVTFFRDEIGDFRQVTLGWDRRLQDVIMYVSPAYHGAVGRLSYQVDQTAGQADAAKTVVSGSIDYKKDGFYAGLAFEMLSEGFADAAWSDTLGVAPVERAVFGDAATGLRGGIKYMAGDVGFAALFQTLANYNQGDFAVNPHDPEVAKANDRKAASFGGEGRYRFDARFAAKIGYYATDPDTDLDDDEFALLAFGIDHTYAKDLWFYLQYAVLLNGDATSIPLGCKCNGHGKIVTPAGPGESPAGISLGIAKTF